MGQPRGYHLIGFYILSVALSGKQTVSKTRTKTTDKTRTKTEQKPRTKRDANPTQNRRKNNPILSGTARNIKAVTHFYKIRKKEYMTGSKVEYRQNTKRQDVLTLPLFPSTPPPRQHARHLKGTVSGSYLSRKPKISFFSEISETITIHSDGTSLLRRLRSFLSCKRSLAKSCRG